MIHDAGKPPPHVQVGMVLVNEHGERWKVANLVKYVHGPMVAEMVVDPEPPTMTVPCSELREQWCLAEDFDDGDD